MILQKKKNCKMKKKGNDEVIGVFGVFTCFPLPFAFSFLFISIFLNGTEAEYRVGHYEDPKQWGLSQNHGYKSLP